MSTPSSRSLPDAPLSPSETGEYTHAPDPHHPRRADDGHVPRRARPDDRAAPSIRTIADDLNGLSVQAWVTTAYLITSTITTPIYGKLGDLYGRKKLFMFAISVFIVGSALCSFATSMYMLAAFRAVQGIGAGGLFTLVLAIIGDIVSPRERARYTGYFMAIVRYVERPRAGDRRLLRLPCGDPGPDRLALGVPGQRARSASPRSSSSTAPCTSTTSGARRASTGGARSRSWSALVPLLTVAEQGRAWGWSLGRGRWPATCIGAIGLGAFSYAERADGRRRDDPAADVPHRAPSRSASPPAWSSAWRCSAASWFSRSTCRSCTAPRRCRSGFLMLPMVVGMMSASIVSGQVISRTGRIRAFPIFGLGADRPSPVRCCRGSPPTPRCCW